MGISESYEAVIAYMPDIIVNQKMITIEVQNEYQISQASIIYDSLFTRKKLDVNDVMLTKDINTLKIEIDQKYTTVKEVNLVLPENYVLKNELSNCYTKTK